jgi:hypothetical protein
LIQDINYNIWRGHRQSNLQWELTLNITPKKKRNYRKQHRNEHSQSTSSQTPTQINSPGLGHDTLQQVQRRKRRRNVFIESQPVSANLRNGEIYKRPYYKPHSLIDQSQHIRWTSSNFLHSGSWETHRDTILFNDNIDLLSFTVFSTISHLLPNR